MKTSPPRSHALAETAAAYASGPRAAGHAKLSITLPNDLVEQVRQAAMASRTSVSAVIAAALLSTISRADQDLLDRALEAQNEENLAWAEAFTDATARIWSKIEW